MKTHKTGKKKEKRKKARKKKKKKAIYQDKSQHVNFQGNPLYQATKQHLNNRQMVKKMMKNEMDG